MEEFECLATGFIEEHGVDGGKARNLPQGMIHLSDGVALLPSRLSYHPLGKEVVEGIGHGFRVAGIERCHSSRRKVGESTIEGFADFWAGDRLARAE
jgi:hypothetical protein